MAVGSYANYDDTFAEEWNGTSWTALATPSIDSTDFANYLYGVSCTSTTFCVAVGWAYSTGPSKIPVLLTWNGTSFTLDTAPPLSANAYLNAVSCAGSSCQAVGGIGIDNAPLALSLAGGTWSSESVPAGAGNSDLASVSCVTASFCVAGGSQNDQRSNYFWTNLVEVWNGSTWNVQQVPDASATYGDGIEAVDCFGPTSCVTGG